MELKHPEGSDGHAQQVLIVDDDAPIRSLLKHLFRRMGFETIEASDGTEAVAQLNGKLPQLMMLDLMMPKMTGWEVIDHLRKSALLERIPVIVLTAVGSQGTDGLVSQGVRAVLNKPFEIDELTRVVNETLGREG